MATTSIVPEKIYTYFYYICIIHHSYSKHKRFRSKTYLWYNFDMSLLRLWDKIEMQNTYNQPFKKLHFVTKYTQYFYKKLENFSKGGIKSTKI